MITLYGSGESFGNAEKDLYSDWQQFVAGQLGIKGSPQIRAGSKRQWVDHCHRSYYFSK